MQYGTCVSSCQRRCSALSVPQRCGVECEEGCVCPHDTFYNHRTHTCVHRYCRRSHLLHYLTHMVQIGVFKILLFCHFHSWKTFLRASCPESV